MHRLATLVALLTLTLFALAGFNKTTDGLDLAVVGVLLSFTTWRSATMGSLSRRRQISTSLRLTLA